MTRFALVLALPLFAGACNNDDRSEQCKTLCTGAPQTAIDACVLAVDLCEALPVFSQSCVDAAIGDLQNTCDTTDDTNDSDDGTDTSL